GNKGATAIWPVHIAVDLRDDACFPAGTDAGGGAGHMNGDLSPAPPTQAPPGRAAARGAAAARARRARQDTRVRLLRVALVLLIVAGMYWLNVSFGNLTMPN